MDSGVGRGILSIESDSSFVFGIIAFVLVPGRFFFGWTVVKSLKRSTDIAYGRDLEPSFLLSSSRKQMKIVLQAIW